MNKKMLFVTICVHLVFFYWMEKNVKDVFGLWKYEDLSCFWTGSIIFLMFGQLLLSDDLVAVIWPFGLVMFMIPSIINLNPNLSMSRDMFVWIPEFSAVSLIFMCSTFTRFLSLELFHIALKEKEVKQM